MPDFFISYTSADEAWAEWIAWTLEENGFKAVVQKWDFAAGSNFVLEMQRAAAQAKRTIAVLSPDYLSDSRFGAAEWASAFAKDPDGLKRALIPVRVRACAAEGLLNTIVHVDLVGLDEAAARKRLLDNVTGARRKPAGRPSFPGASPAAGAPHVFPGKAPAEPIAAPAPRYMPKVRGAITDVDRRRFIREAFALIQERFELALAELTRQNAGVDVDMTRVDATKFTAEIFVGGQSRARCKIWIGGMMGGDDIAYSEGHTSAISNSLNEDLTLHEVDGELRLRSLMGGATGRRGEGPDPQRLNAEDAAEYLWRRFAAGLER
ncbi:MAG: toll/interleukin-1 receptor domain-containing protein [Alphaproteobacteria bacterium]